MTLIIHTFRNQHRFLSNFWPCKVELAGEEYPSVEHAYQAAKTEDLTHRKAIRSSLSAGMAKSLGKLVPMRMDWDDVKRDVMYSLLIQKFIPGSALASMLEDTGDAHLEEGNTWGDRYWGVCDGTGQNHLGHLLMQIREENRRAHVS